MTDIRNLEREIITLRERIVAVETQIVNLHQSDISQAGSIRDLTAKIDGLGDRIQALKSSVLEKLAEERDVISKLTAASEERKSQAIANLQSQMSRVMLVFTMAGAVVSALIGQFIKIGVG